MAASSLFCLRSVCDQFKQAKCRPIHVQRSHSIVIGLLERLKSECPRPKQPVCQNTNVILLEISSYADVHACHNYIVLVTGVFKISGDFVDIFVCAAWISISLLYFF